MRRYKINSRLSLELSESPEQKQFPKCPHCGQGHYWNVVWPTALVFSKLLAKRSADFALVGKRVLVIGCGAGLESIVAAKLGADVCVLDHCAEALRLTRENCRLNGVENIKTTKCCWLDAEKVSKLRRYDVLIGCEVLYNIDKKETLARLIMATLKKDGFALFAEPERIAAKDPKRLLDGASFQIVASFSQLNIDGVEVWVYQVRRTDG
jgi:2-polyprenyl-3-methyl-5-hydroxy-6-metoxy-1,4-benzoquinol methylase